MLSSWCKRNHAALAWLIGSCAMAQGCPAVDGKDVVVGSESDALFVATCAGARTDCEKTVKSRSMGTSEVLECDPEPASALELDWQTAVEPTECLDSTSDTCQLDFQPRLMVDGDGGVWIVASYVSLSHDDTPSPHGVWLAHYDAHGTLTAGTTVIAEPHPAAGHTAYQPDIALTSRGHAVVSVYSVEAENADVELDEKVLVVEYDQHGKLVGKPSTLTGIGDTHIALDAGDQIVVASNAAANAHHGVLAGLDSDRALRFSQTSLDTRGGSGGSGVSGVTVDARGRISVLMERTLDGESPGQQHFAFTQFDADGNPLWDRMLDTEFSTTYGLSFGTDGDANMIMTYPLGDGREPTPQHNLLAKVSARGELLFEMDLVTAYGTPQISIEHGGENRIFGLWGIPQDGSYVFEIAADGTRCKKHALADDSYSVVEPGHDGYLYVFDLQHSKVGRMKPLAGE